MSFKAPIRTLSRIAPRYRLCGTIDRLGADALSRRHLSPSRPSICSSRCSPLFAIEPRALFNLRRHSTMATEDVNKANVLEEAQIDETKDVQDSEEDSDPGPIFEKWRPMIDAIADGTKEAFPASPSFDPSSPSTFQTFWRGVFTSLKDSVLKNQEIPHYLTEPPVSTCSVTLFDNRHALGCPCCQSPSEPAIELENENGVTKEDFMNAIVNTMYGEALPKVFIESEPMYQEDDETDDADDDDVESEDGSEDDAPETASFKNDSGVLVYTYGWMSAGGKNEGGTVMYGDEPDIILYCCPPDEFEKRTKKDEKDSKEPKEPKEARESKL
ncbi:hypothetical protein NCS57_00438100 [Fusarium keratoplasticum]|uniref:Uncharacterized protein n=1 Tax=Fusarium keratoplasticum TaxID=1328300 RepID=A0ACC0R4W3_9HYPO|nr:hypothetical protein NCS57_00438100 [Fusarium keratoplasticum]KAI8675370.1 hypothetical protein NCS57_00438100 [Fusarium keratoplasticum]